ncbi:TPA: type III secretion system effector SopD2 [Salmonella enterica subsp. enterica serovar Yopougon]
MPITLSFGNHHHYEINRSRLVRLMNSDKEQALYMGVWDRFKDNFRTQKKQDALEVLYTLIHGCGREKQAERDVDTDAMDKIHAFEKLRLYADPSQQDRFVMDFDITQTQIKFWIDGEVISKCSLQRLLNLSDNYVLKPMTDEEEELFLKICAYYGRTISLKPELLQDMALKLRDAISEDEGIMDELYKLMRPGEDRKMPCVEWNGTLTADEEKKLCCLCMGSYDPGTQFFKMGYRESSNGEVIFEMIHPTLLYLLRGYTPSLTFTESNTELLTGVLNRDYDDYHNDKEGIDRILDRIYKSHNGTLFISNGTISRNML